MKARVEYNKKEVCEIVLKQHVLTFAAPVGMKWTAKLDYTDTVTCELVDIETHETQEAQP